MMFTSPGRAARRLLLSVAAVSLLAGCGSTQATSTQATPAQAPSTAAYPLSLPVPGQDQPLVLKSRPERIAVLSPDAATAVDELVGTGPVIAVPSSSQRPSTSVRVQDFAHVPHVIPDGVNPDPEQVLSWNPDLVVVTARHTGETDASAALTQAGVPVLTLTNNWQTPKDVADNITLIGRALDAEAKAAELVSRIDSGMAAVREQVASVTERPSVLIMPNMGGKVYVSATNVLTSALVDAAGGVNAAVEAGYTHTMPVSPEQVVAADPDMIMLIDVMGAGEKSFSAVMDNPAVRKLPAVRDGKVRLFSASKIYGIGGVELVDGLKDIAGWLHPTTTR
ncbi:ABC transporter substrate-binding protein [Nonomuraea maritima]|uniref:ABC transporter substrate-binding protein n=1 Tax=Nonomuraea maritima TaxID=683260 RepID=UPI00371CBF2B